MNSDTPPPIPHQPNPTQPWRPSDPAPKVWKDPFQLEPMSEAPTALNSIAALLKSPGRVFYQLGEPGGVQLGFSLLACAALCLLAFGFLLGTFSGGAQLWMAPSKILLGTAASALICLPSLVIFSLLGGTECSITKLGALLR
jgi:hypothetical protein